MTKTELIKHLALRNQVTVEEASTWVESIFSVIRIDLAQGEEVKLTGFGSFVPKLRAGGIRRNPRTGEKVEVGPKKTVGFKPSPALKAFMNE